MIDRSTSPDLNYGLSNRVRLKQVTSGSTTLGLYKYTAQGVRGSKVAGSATTHYLYDQTGHLIAEADGTTGATIREYAWLPDEDGIDLPIAQIDAGGTYAILSDQLGTPQKLADSTKAIVWDRVQKPFGETVSTTGSANTNLRFPGQYADAESGLVYNFFRDYDPTLGRYVEPDPIGQRGGLNAYRYVRQNPTIYIDRNGNVVSGFGGVIRVAGGVRSGAVTGGTAGGIAGSILPGVGSVAGAAVGADIGGIVGGGIALYNELHSDDSLDGASCPIEKTNQPDPYEVCYEKCKHLLPSPSGDLQGSEFSACQRKCLGRL